MKKNDLIDLKTKTVDELRRTLADMSGDIAKLKIDKVAGKSVNLSAIKTKRHDIARVLTFIKMKSYSDNQEVKEVDPVK